MRDLFVKDFWWKLLSLLLAGFIWYTVHKIIEEPKAAAVSAATIPVTYGNVPVAIVATTADVHAYGVNSNTISVTVSGDKEVMDILQANQIHAFLDLSNFDDKSKDFDRRVEVTVPWGVTVINVEPAKLKVIPPKK